MHGAECQVNVGKPDPIMLETIMGLIGLDAEECVMTGDRLYTEIRMARDAGMPSAVVLTGETTAEELEAEAEENLPDYTLEEDRSTRPARPLGGVWLGGRSIAMAEGPYLLGIDFGTGGARVGIFDPEGTPLVFTEREFTLKHPRPGWAEQDPDEWSSLVEAVRAAMEER